MHPMTKDEFEQYRAGRALRKCGAAAVCRSSGKGKSAGNVRKAV